MADGTEPTDSRSGDLALEPAAPPTGGRTRALWGVLAVVAVAAGALAISSGGGDDGTPRLPIGLGASGQREAAGALAADMSLAWVTYVAGDDLPSLGGEGTAYRVAADVDEGVFADLAAALGLSGEPVRDGSYWRLEADGAYLEVDGASGAWWYTATNGPVASGGSASGGGSAGCEPGPAVDCAFSEVGTAIEDQPATTVVECKGGDDCLTTEPVRDPCPPGTDCALPAPECPPDADCVVPDTTVPEPPADLPSEDEARRIALELLAGTGVDVDDAKVTVDGPYDAWYVTVEPRLDGQTVSGWLASVGVGSEGEVTSASGTLGSPEELGDYPLLDTRAAIDRLNELQGGGFGGVVPMDTADDAARAAASAEAGAAASAQCTAPPPGSPTTECGDTVMCVVQPDGSTVCEGDGVDPAPTTTIACKVQPDGRGEICEVAGDPGSDCVTILPDPAPEPPCPPVPPSGCLEISPEPACPPDPSCVTLQAPVAGGATGSEGASGVASGAPDAGVSSEVCPEPVPYPEPEPIEVVLTEAERVLVLSPAVDGTTQLYLVPGYRFSNADGHLVEVVAVADDSLAPTTTAPEPPVTEPGVDPGDCAVLTEEDASGSTHTVQSCPTTTSITPGTEPRPLEPGEAPAVGVGYYVDVDVACAAFELGGEIWILEQGDLTGWSTPHEGGTFTLDAPDHGTFVGDAGGDKTATFETGTDPDGCQPTARG